MMAKKHEIKNYFSTITSNFTRFSDVDEDMYYLERSNPIDGQRYTCMRHENEVKIFKGILNENMYYLVKPLIEVEL